MDETGAVTVAVAPGSERLRPALDAIGATETALETALVVVADGRGGDLSQAIGDEVRARRGALLVVVTGGADADRAFSAGATHVAYGNDTDELTRALRFAGRYVRRLARAEPMRTRSRYGRVPPAIAAALMTGERDIRLMIVALPRFAVVNAAFGREAGDRILTEVHDRIERALDGAATIVRRGGAEFIAVTTRADAARTISDALDRPFAVDGTMARLGHRIAVARREADEDAALLLYRANQALASARSGDGLVHSLGADDARLAADLHRALDRGEINVLFQPQALLATGTIVGVEALARWTHPEAGDVGAEALFAAAARADLTVALSDRVQALALAEAAAWPLALAHLKVSLNVTADDLARGDFVERLLARIDEAGIARARITVELTESGLIGDLDRTATLLSRLRGAGCRIAIDDFGTGYSSLAYLKALPIDFLKIDRSLVVDAAGAGRDRALVRAVIAIARSLGLETIAEGVETSAQREALSADGCTLLQGFLCAPPLTTAALIEKVEG